VAPPLPKESIPRARNLVIWTGIPRTRARLATRGDAMVALVWVTIVTRAA
jgi:hypothetical protein